MTTPVEKPTAAQALALALIDASQQPMLLFDGALNLVGASRSFRATFGLSRDQVAGNSLRQLGSGEWDQAELQLMLENVRSDGAEAGDLEIDLKRAGSEARRLIVNAQTVVQGDASGVLVLLTINDVTATRRVEEVNISLLLEKDGLLRERAVLLQEMQHRIANSLQIIASILMLKARAVKSAETRRHLRDAHDRVMSVAAVQRHLQENLGDVEIRPYLTKLCESLAASMIRESRPLAIHVRADEAVISSHQAVSLGLIVTELVINALKHAFPNGRGGVIDVGYDVTPDGWVLSVEDDGVGRPTEPPIRRAGLGTTVVEALARQLGCDVTVSDAALGARIVLAHVEVAKPTLEAAGVA
ncbi:MAG TPA: histidine kinase dimerization/phosphoacceptor domain -containing protein [Caulobacteraceae bacterium]|jgi:PAS domain S-box-containing protein|nr:histidine kinase dimerization/phosphoacceptor domain -containing protein [Caulobacteraceae bacterium]